MRLAMVPIFSRTTDGPWKEMTTEHLVESNARGARYFLVRVRLSDGTRVTLPMLETMAAKNGFTHLEQFLGAGDYSTAWFFVHTKTPGKANHLEYRCFIDRENHTWPFSSLESGAGYYFTEHAG